MTDPSTPKPPADTSWIRMDEVSEGPQSAERPVNNEAFAGLYLVVVLVVGAFWQAAHDQGLPAWFRVGGVLLSAVVLYLWLKSRLDRAAGARSRD
jgi:hypothetical protein